MLSTTATVIWQLLHDNSFFFQATHSTHGFNLSHSPAAYTVSSQYTPLYLTQNQTKNQSEILKLEVNIICVCKIIMQVLFWVHNPYS